MSDKKFDFLNNPITCTVTVLALPTGSAPPNRSTNQKCLCFDGRCKKSYREVENLIKDKDCLFQAVELARYLADHVKTDNKLKVETIEEDSNTILLKKARSVKMMQQQHKILKSLGNTLKNSVLTQDEQKNEGNGFDISYLTNVFT